MTLEDAVVLVGIVLVGVGLYFVSWPLVVVWVGLLLMTAGGIRLRQKGKRPQRRVEDE
jgi:hypothetical protein